jgi:hypothetical protein
MTTKSKLPKPNNQFSATCLHCGAEFMQSGNDLQAILESYKIWDKGHGCPEVEATS